MESAEGTLVKVDDLDEASRYTMVAHLDELIVNVPTGWFPILSAKRIERALCAEIQDLVKHMRLLVDRHEVQADTRRTGTKRRFALTISFTIEAIDTERADRLTQCLDSFVESIHQRQSGEFSFGFKQLGEPDRSSLVQHHEPNGIDVLLLATRIIHEDRAAQA